MTSCLHSNQPNLLAFVLAEAATRTYYLGIVEENWDYAPSGENLITGQNLTEDDDLKMHRKAA
uniref:Uncharacterized protein n=1 Tax=Podarcis muralis TaxID=64176 RepID=A0A670KBI8_PODMU